MILYFADRQMAILGKASTGMPKGNNFTDDEKTESIDTGVKTYAFRLPYTDENRAELEACTDTGNYLLLYDERSGADEFYTILDQDLDTLAQEIHVYAEDAGLDLLNEVVGPYEASQAQTAEFYIKLFSAGSGFEVGINEITDLSRKLSWDGEQTATARIRSVATQFDNAEISYSFEVDNMRVTKKLINVYKKRGKEIGSELRLNRDIDRIVRKKSISNLATGLRVTGGTQEGSNTPISLLGQTYDDGRFFVLNGNLLDRQSNARWARYLTQSATGDDYIIQTYSYDTTDSTELLNRSISELTKRSQPEINYEIDIVNLPDNARLGDTINIVDDDGHMYLSARILELKTSYANETAKAVIGDYLIKTSGISDQIEALADKYETIAATRTLYTWIAYADDVHGSGITDDPAGKTYMGTAPNKLTESMDLSDPDIFTWALIKGADGAPGVDGKQGAQGLPGIQGEPGESGSVGKIAGSYDTLDDLQAAHPTGAEGEYYLVSGSLYIWDVDQAAWDNVGDISGPPGTPGPQGIPGVSGIDGDDAISAMLTNDSMTLPADINGTVISFTGASGNIYVFKGLSDVSSSATYTVAWSGMSGTWASSTRTYKVTSMSGKVGTLTITANYNGTIIKKIFTVTKGLQDIQVDTLDAITANVGNLTTGPNGSITSPFTLGANQTGDLTIQHGEIDMSYSNNNDNGAGSFTLNPEGLSGSQTLDDGSGDFINTSYALGSGGLTLSSDASGSMESAFLGIDDVLGITTGANISTTEVKTNETYNGRPVYRKLILLGQLPNGTTKTIQTGLSNLAQYWIDFAFAGNGTSVDSAFGATYTLPYVDPLAVINSVGLRVYGGGGQISVSTGTSWSGYYGFASLKYTKA